MDRGTRWSVSTSLSVHPGLDKSVFAAAIIKRFARCKKGAGQLRASVVPRVLSEAFRLTGEERRGRKSRVAPPSGDFKKNKSMSV